MTDSAFQPLRRPVLGHVVEWDQATDRYRVVVAADGQVLHEGALEDCEQRLVARLEELHGHGRPVVRLPTLGGLQFWSDVFWYADWRIQENAFTGHHRLLDPDDWRRAWGTREACRAAFEAIRLEERVTLPADHLVLLLHGLGRTRGSLARLRRALAAAGFASAAVGYPSTRQSIEEHAAGLSGLLDALDGVKRVSFVTHSLGGIVARHTLATPAAWQQRIEVGRLAMLAPPSHGSSLADALREFLPFRLIAGPSGQELTTAEFDAVPMPTCRFGIVAGGRGDGRGWNPWVPGDDDGVVGVDEARLPGAEDFTMVSGLHSFLMNDPDVVDAVVRYLTTGGFR
ncbi:MAG: lipase [Planctomycetota bacterium]